MYLLDTNICIYIIKQKPIEVLHRLSEISPVDIGISSITVAELEFGVRKSKFVEQNEHALRLFLHPFEIHVFDDICAHHYGIIRSELEKQGEVIGSMDMLIAAQALALEKRLVTNNVREFKKVPRLQIENWVE